MRGAIGCAVGILLAGLLLASDDAGTAKAVTWTGWFSDLDCGRSTTAGGKLGPTNPDCSRRCIEKGTAPAFISEQAKAVFMVTDGRPVAGDLGYHVEVQARVNEAARTIEIESVKQLSYDGAACSRPRKTAAQK